MISLYLLTNEELGDSLLKHCPRGLVSFKWCWKVGAKSRFKCWMCKSLWAAGTGLAKSWTWSCARRTLASLFHFFRLVSMPREYIPPGRRPWSGGLTSCQTIGWPPGKSGTYTCRNGFQPALTWTVRLTQLAAFSSSGVSDWCCLTIRCGPKLVLQRFCGGRKEHGRRSFTTCRFRKVLA